MYSRLKIFGHPIHPMLVAYPIALYTSTLVAYLIYIVGHDTFWFKVAVVVNIGAIIMAAVTALPGFLDWAIGIPNASPAKAHGLNHMLLNVAALILFVINAIIHTGQFLSATPEGGWGFVLALVGVGCTVAAGFFGWTMIQTDHVGVDLTPEQQRLERERLEQEEADRAGAAPA
jgi:uncharacterized membrane protein